MQASCRLALAESTAVSFLLYMTFFGLSFDTQCKSLKADLLENFLEVWHWVFSVDMWMGNLDSLLETKLQELFSVGILAVAIPALFLVLCNHVKIILMDKKKKMRLIKMQRTWSRLEGKNDEAESSRWLLTWSPGWGRIKETWSYPRRNSAQIASSFPWMRQMRTSHLSTPDWNIIWLDRCRSVYATHNWDLWYSMKH